MGTSVILNPDNIHDLKLQANAEWMSPLPGFDEEEHFLYHNTARLNRPGEEEEMMLVTCAVVDDAEEMAEAKPTAFQAETHSAVAAWIHDWATHRDVNDGLVPRVRLYESVTDEEGRVRPRGGVYREGFLGRTEGPVRCPVLVRRPDSARDLPASKVNLLETKALQVIGWSDGESHPGLFEQSGGFLFKHPGVDLDADWQRAPAQSKA
jgi:hypothetical protein